MMLVVVVCVGNIICVGGIISLNKNANGYMLYVAARLPIGLGRLGDLREGTIDPTIQHQHSTTPRNAALRLVVAGRHKNWL